MKYKHIVATQVGGPENLQLREDDLPEPKAGQVRIKILAAGVSFSDVLMRRGKYPPGMPAFPFTPGRDLVGIVEKCGTDVKERATGEMVAALTLVGGYSQYICLSEREVVPVPEHLDPAEAVCLVLNYITAYQMLHRLAHSKAGERILVHGAAGGVGTALLQLGGLLHLEMYGTVSPVKQDMVALLGATPIDYTCEDFVARIRTLTGDGVDVVFDAIGGRHLQSSFEALRSGGRLVIYGVSLKNLGQGNLVSALLPISLRVAYWSLFPNGKRAQFYSIVGWPFGLKNRHPDWFREDLMRLFALLAEGAIKPVIAARLPLEDAAHAQELIEHSQIEGKLVLLPNA